MGHLSRSKLAWFIAALSLCACASVEDAGHAATYTGVVKERYIVPKGNSYNNRDVMGALYGAMGLFMIDTLYAVPQHFRYKVLLDNGRTIYAWNRSDVAEGACIALWLNSARQAREGDYPLDSNRIELSTACKADSTPRPDAPS